MLQEKQTFLRQKVIDAGLDAQAFMSFMGSSKGEGQSIDLQNWTMQELQNLVKKFTKSPNLPPQSNQSPVKYRGSLIVADRVIGCNLAKQVRVKYGRDGLYDIELKKKQQCRRARQLLQIQPSSQIKCTGVQVKKIGGFLGFGSKSYIQVSLSTSLTSNKIVKRYSQDVDWLRQRIFAQYPGLYIPPLQQTPVFQTQNKALLQNRAKQIVSFLNSLLYYRQLATSQPLYNFLNEMNPKTFENYKNNNTKITKICELKEVSKAEGYTFIQISQHIVDLILNSYKYSAQLVQIQKDILVNSQKLRHSFQDVAKYSQHLQRSYKKLKQKYLVMSTQCNINQIQSFPTQFNSKYQAILSSAQKLLSQQRKLAKIKQHSLKAINEQLLRYHIKQWEQFHLFAQNQKRQVNQYLNQKLQFQKKKHTFLASIIQAQMKEKQQKGITPQTTLTDHQNILNITLSSDKLANNKRLMWIGYLNYMFEKSFMMLLNQQVQQISKKIIQNYSQSFKIDSRRVQIYKEFLDKYS